MGIMYSGPKYDITIIVLYRLVLPRLINTGIGIFRPFYIRQVTQVGQSVLGMVECMEGVYQPIGVISQILVESIVVLGEQYADESQ